MPREPKKSTPPRTRPRTTRRGLPIPVADPEDEPAVSTRPTKRELSALEPATSTRPTRRDLAEAISSAVHPATGARGQYSISAARGIPVEVVSGSIEVGERRRRRTGPSQSGVRLVSAGKRELTVIVNDQILTLQRTDALALARIIATTFDD